MTRARPTYVVVYEQDHTGWWFVSAPDLPGSHTQGRTLARARARIREAIALCLDVDEEDFDLVDEVRLPSAARQAADETRSARQRAHEAREAAQAATRKAVRTLACEGNLGTRDTAELLGISAQRVSQLLAEQAAERRPASWAPRAPRDRRGGETEGGVRGTL